jgi:lysophospholipase L1-like esterase
MIHYLDIGDKFIDADGSISKEIMPDYLHLSPKGYRIWAEAIEPKLIELMGEFGQSRRPYYWY